MQINMTIWCALAILCWLCTGLCATFAVFSRQINDTLLERVALIGMALSSYGFSWYLISRGWVSNAGLFLSVSFGLYAVVVTLKHWWRYLESLRQSRRRPPAAITGRT